VSYFEDIETLREEIDCIDRKLIEKINDWVQASKKLGISDRELFAVQILELASNYGISVEGVKRVFQEMAVLVNDRRTG
jgi:hypothetical protein